MADRTTPSTEAPLESWKAIAVYLNRDERTVRRWEQAEGLPVRRHRHLARSSVYAYSSELDAWRRGRGTGMDGHPRVAARAGLRASGIAATMLMAILTAGGGRFFGPVVAATRQRDAIVWAGQGVDLFGQVSPDGRVISYVDWAHFANVAVHDVVTNTDRTLTSSASWNDGAASGSTISRDGKLIAYSWNDLNVGIRVLPLDGTATPAPRELLTLDTAVRFVTPHDWSPDGQWIVFSERRTDGTGRIVLVATRDGSVRLLRTVPWRGPDRVTFSPDGRFLAYSLPVGDGLGGSHVFLMALDGSREVVVVSHPSRNTLMGWAPDGHLLFASDRSGSLALWALAVDEGRPAGSPRLIRSHIPSAVSLGMTTAGSLHIWKASGTPFIKVVSIDPAPGRSPKSETGVFQRFIESRGWPDWSADGKLLSYNSCGPGGGGPCTLEIASIETDTVREVEPDLGYFEYARVSPDGRSVAALGTDFSGRSGLYLINVETGAASLLARRDENHRPGAPTWGLDGRRIYYGERNATNTRLIEREIATGSERVAFDGSLPCDTWVKASPDARHLACISRDQTSLLVTPMIGGESRSVLSVAAPRKLGLVGSWNWTPDSRSLIVTKLEPREHWLVSLAGEAQKLDVEPGDDFRLHPDGRHVAFVGVAGERGAEVWALENVLGATRK